MIDVINKPNNNNSSDQIPSFILNSEDISFEYLSSSPSCLRQKRSQPNLNRPLAKFPRLATNSQAIPFNLKPTTTTQSDQIDQTTQYILQARDLLLKACTSCKSHDRQSRLLDLLEVFREYTEFGRIRHTSTILASQVANLEKATQRIESQARAPQAKAQTAIQTKAPQYSIQPTWAKIADNQKEDWILISNKKKENAKSIAKSKDKSALSRRYTLL
jgi:hypothetical protein